ncbi:Uncharacterized protein ToN1_33070 [Aromatoleum petrolei]|nr:Uncharacterized protein ToN1_33070 [Aromatoleum petrolei]
MQAVVLTCAVIAHRSCIDLPTSSTLAHVFDELHPQEMSRMPKESLTEQHYPSAARRSSR